MWARRPHSLTVTNRQCLPVYGHDFSQNALKRATLAAVEKDLDGVWPEGFA